MDDQELIDRIPLGKIRELQEQLKGGDTGTEFLQLSSVSDEAIKVASEIYLYIK